MKHVVPIFALLTGCSSAVTPPVVTPPPTLTWESNGNSSLPYCGSTVKTACLLTYTLTQDGAVVAQNIPGAALSYVLSTLPAAGSHVYQLTINGTDQSGKAIASGPATTTVVIP